MKRIIGYVNMADLNHMREEDVRALTVINIAFGLIRDGEVVWDAKDARDGMVSIRKSNPELKIVLSVGGWGADGFSQAARTKEGRERFAASALAIVKEYGLDGIDIDWEYPGTSLAGIASDRSDKENYTLLLAELRKTLDAYREGMLVTTAVGGDVYFALQTDMKEASRYLDYVQLMTDATGTPFVTLTKAGQDCAVLHTLEIVCRGEGDLTISFQTDEAEDAAALTLNLSEYPAYGDGFRTISVDFADFASWTGSLKTLSIETTSDVLDIQAIRFVEAQ